jgi:segregation and condensation protein B
MPSINDRDQLQSVIDSLLFIADGPVDIRTLAKICEATADDVNEALDELAEESKSRGIRIQRTSQSAQMVSAPETAPFVQSFLGIDEHQRLSPTVLVTLTVIAYKQPVTRGEVERILRKNCEYSVMVLKARELITEVGRAEGPGRPYLYGTTFKFLEHFGLEKATDLPPLPELEVAAAAAAQTEDTPEGSETLSELAGEPGANGASAGINGAQLEADVSNDAPPEFSEAPAE